MLKQSTKDFKIPLKPILEDVKVLLEGIGAAMEARASFRSSCAQIEADIKGCSPSVETMLDGLAVQDAIVESRIDAMEAAGLEMRQARRRYGEALAAKLPQVHHAFLCDAYQELVGRPVALPATPAP